MTLYEYVEIMEKELKEFKDHYENEYVKDPAAYPIEYENLGDWAKQQVCFIDMKEQNGN